MDLIERINSGESIYTLFSNLLEEQKIARILDAQNLLTQGRLEEECDLIAKDYEFNKDKLKLYKGIENVGNRSKLLEFMRYLDSLKLAKSNKVSVLLTGAILLNKYDLNQVATEDLYLCSSIYIPVPLNHYENYKVLLNPKLLERLNIKTNDDSVKRTIAYSMQDYIDATDDNRLLSLVDIIDKYKMQEVKRV